jgi:hypothetical protein
MMAMMYQAVDIKSESLALRTEDCLNCVYCLMIVIMYQTVDRKPESLANNEDRVLLESRILFYDGYNTYIRLYSRYKT